MVFEIIIIQKINKTASPKLRHVVILNTEAQNMLEMFGFGHLHVPLGGAGDEEVLGGVQGQGFDGGVVGLEGVQQLPLADVKDAHKALAAPRDDELLLGRILQHSGPVVMAREGWRNNNIPNVIKHHNFMVSVSSICMHI